MQNKETTVKERLVAFIKYRGLSIRAFEQRIGVSNSFVNNISKGMGADKMQRIISAFPDLDTGWLMTGEGEMLRAGAPSGAPPPPTAAPAGRPVPVIHADSVGGMDSANSITDEPQYVERLVTFPGAQEGDVAVIQSGDSMTPTIPPGALVHIRRVPDWREFFGYGGIFVLVLRDGRRVTKEVRRADDPDHVLCVSHNPDVAPEPLPRHFIAEVWKVLGVLITKEW